jgi:zinc/manganese transport system substrate-binding protein
VRWNDKKIGRAFGSALRSGAGLALLAGLVATTLSGCAPAQPKATAYVPHAGKLQIITSVAVWANIAQSIGGNLVEAKAIVARPDQDPHSYEASVRDQLAVNRADLTITNGANYDTFFAKLVAAKPNPHTGMQLNLADRVNQHTPSPNPHLWYDLVWTRDLAGLIGRTEAAAMPTAADAAAINARTAAYQARLGGLIHRERAMVRQTIRFSAILTEGFAERMLRNLAILDMTPREFRVAVEREQDASPAAMFIIRRLMNEHRVSILVQNVQTAGSQTAQIAGWATANRIPILNWSELLPAHTSYLGWMNQNLSQIEGTRK